MIGWSVLTAIIILFLGTAVGCSSSSSPRRGSLSDAMEEASDDDDDTYPKADTESSDRNDETDGDDNDGGAAGLIVGLLVDEEQNATLDADSESEEAKVEFIGLSGSSGAVKGDDFYGLRRAMISVGGFIGERTKIELRGAVSHVPIQKTSYLDESLDGGIVMWQAGGAGKFFTTRRHTFMGQYFIIGVNWTYMMWTYKNPISVDDETIETDGLNGFDMYVGLGWNLVQTKPFRLGLEATPGLILWTGTTSEGFDNDVFDTFYYVRVGVTVQFGL